jgi:hypothetical protein
LPNSADLSAQVFRSSAAPPSPPIQASDGKFDRYPMTIRFIQ